MERAGSNRQNRQASIHVTQARFVIALVLLLGLIFLIIPIPSSWNHSKVIRDIAIAFITSGVISLIYEIMLRNSFLSEMKEQLAHSLASEFEVLNRIDDAGIVDVYHMFPTSDIAKSFSTASEIRIMQTWIPDLVTLLRGLKEASRSGCVIKILLLNPDSYLAEARGRELGYPETKVVSDSIRNNLAEISRFCNEEGIVNSLEVRLHETIPSVCIHSYDDMMYVGFYLSRVPAIQNPQIVIKGNTSFFSVALNQHFSKIWSDAITCQIKT